MRIRRTTNHELVLALDRVLFPETYQELPHHGNRYWLVRDEEGEPVGFASARPLRESSRDPRWADTVFLSRVGILPSARKRGLQRRLIRARLRWAKHDMKFERAVTYVTWANVWSARALVREGFLPFVPAYHWAGNVLYLEREL